MSMKNYSNRAKNLVKKHPAASKKFGIQSVEFYYNMFHMNHNKITFQTIQTNSILNFLKICDVIKAVGIDNVCGKFLKVGVNVFADIQTISFFKRLQCSKVEISVQKRD